MILTRKYAVALLATVACGGAIGLLVRAQLPGQMPASAATAAPSGWTINRTLVVLDPAHGGSESGAVLGDHALEKDITLAIASRLRAALTAEGFTVISTRDTDGPDPLSTDQRAEIANRTHAMACVVIHATTTGSGVHLYTSTLQPPPAEADLEAPHSYVPVSWAAAQEAFMRQSLSLARELSTSLGKARLPALVGQAPMRPLDNLTCPAVAIELAPLPAHGADAMPVTDTNYQQQVVNALAVALRAWRDSPDLLPPAKARLEDGQTTAQTKAIAAAESAGRAAARVRSAPGPSAAQKGPL